MYDDTEYGETGYDVILLQDDFIEQMRAEGQINDHEPLTIPVEFKSETVRLHIDRTDKPVIHYVLVGGSRVPF